MDEPFTLVSRIQAVSGYVLTRVERFSGVEVFNVNLKFYLHGDMGAERLVVIYPDLGEDQNGHQGRSLNAALYLQQLGFGVIRLPNVQTADFPDADYKQVLDTNLRALTDEILLAGEGKTNRRWMMMGIGVGASAVAVVAPSLQLVDSILLISPVEALDLEAMTAGLSGFKGELRIMAGDAGDAAQTRPVAERLFQASGSTRHRELVVAKGAERSFSGEVHEAVFLKSALWAFAGGDLQVPGARYEVRSGHTQKRGGVGRTGQAPSGPAQAQL